MVVERVLSDRLCYCCVFFIFLLLPVSIFADCINASDINTTKIIDLVYASPDSNQEPDSGCSRDWVKSGVKLSDVERVVAIVDKGINLCAKGSGNNESESMVVVVNARDLYTDLSQLSLRQNDSVKFSYFPYISNQVITHDICENSDPNIKVLNESRCKLDYVDKVYSSIIGNDLGNSASNLLIQSNFDTSRWINAPLIVIDPIDDPNDPSSTNFITKIFKEAGDVFEDSNHLWRSVCLNSYNSDLERYYVETIRSSMSSYDLNTECGNICHIKYDRSGNEVDRVTQDCVFTVTQEMFVRGSSTAEYKQFFPYSRSYEQGGDNFEHGSVGLGSGTGLNHEYLLKAVNPSVLLLIRHISELNNAYGGYTMHAYRKCTYHNKRSLYYYISDVCPDSTLKPGDLGTDLIEMTDYDGNYINIRNFTLQPSWNGKNIYYGVKDNGDGIQNNVGHFELTTSVPKDLKTPFGNLVEMVLDNVNFLLYGDGGAVNRGAVGSIYQAILDSHFVQIVQGMILLAISVYSLLYIMGMFKASQVDIIALLVKIGIVIIAISPNSWDFFNVYLFPLFRDGSLDLINIMTEQGELGEVGQFDFIDKSLARFADSGTWIQIAAIILTGPVGFLMAFIIIWGVWMLFLTILTACIVYFISIIIIAVLLCIAPLFLSTVLFKRTRTVFDNWIRLLANNAIQPVMMFAVIAMFNDIIMGITHSLMGYDVCKQCVTMVTLDDDIEAFCLLNTFLPVNYNAQSGFKDLIEENYYGFSFFGVPIPLYSLIAFVVLCHALQGFIQKIPEMVGGIFGVMGAELTQPADTFQDTMRATVGMDEQSIEQRAHSEYQKKLRDTPEEVRDVREEKRQAKRKGGAE